MSSSTELAAQLAVQSREHPWEVHTGLDWPDRLSGERPLMPPELVSIYGTELYDELSEAQKHRLGLYEVANLFSLTLLGERPLVAGLSDRLYGKSLSESETEYAHRFIDEENKHMEMFGTFLRRYVGKVYPEKKIDFERVKERSEREVAFFCKVLVVEELGDYYNVKMMRDASLEPIVRQISEVHHRDESRHLGFGRRHLAELCEATLPSWSAEQRTAFTGWLQAYVRSSWNDFYNPRVYEDAGLGNGFPIRRMALSHPATAEHRKRASKKLLNTLGRIGLWDDTLPI
jgi:hypothetical protein